MNPSPRSRRRFLKSLVIPAAAIAVPVPFGIALAADEAEKPKTPAAATDTPPASKPPAFPDYSIARTPEERATLEKQWNQMHEILDAVRKAKVAEDVPPAVHFAALAPALKKGAAASPGSKAKRP
ncbi:MAG: hypothetical protein ACREOU_00090 [Candidatus Eiseniibacteriota bacterium]